MSLQDCVAVTSIENIDTSLVAPLPTFSGITLTQGAVKIPALQAVWGVSISPYVTGIQFEYREASGSNPAIRTAPQGIGSLLWQEPRVVAGKTYRVWYRAVSEGAYGSWVQALLDVTIPTDFTSNDSGSLGGVPAGTLIPAIPGLDTTPPAAPSGLTVQAAFQTAFLQWTNPADTDLSRIEIWENSVDNQGTATLIGHTAAKGGTVGAWGRQGLSPGVLRYYWVRGVDLAGNVGPFNGTAGTPVTTASLVHDDFSSGIKPVGRGSALPTASTYAGDTFYLTTDQKLYRKNSAGTGWIATVAAIDINGQITGSQITAGVITASHIASATITGDRIAGNTITGTNIQASSIAADRLNVAQLSSISANIGTITAGLLQDSTGLNFLDLTNARQQFRVGGYVSRKGNLGSFLLEWFGPASVAMGSETIANSIWAISANDGKVYYGTVEVGTGGGGTPSVTVGISAGLVQTSGSTTGSVTATGGGGTSPYSYAWSKSYDWAFDDSGGSAYIKANSPTSDSTTFTLVGTNPAPAGEFTQAGFLVTATDSAGASASRLVGARFNA